jgi:hypothetical protein
LIGLRNVKHAAQSEVAAVHAGVSLPCAINISSYQDMLILYLQQGWLSVTLPPVNFPEANDGQN